MRRLLLLLSLGMSLIGCQDRSDDGQPKTSAGNETSSDGSSSGEVIRLTVVFNNHETDEFAPTETKTFDNPTSEIIREQVNALEWENPHHGIGVSLDHGELPNKRTMTITGTLNASGDQKPFVARVFEQEGIEIIGLTESHVLPSKDVAIDLLISFLNQDGKYLEAVEWTPQ